MVVKAILSRLLFFAHGFVCVYMYQKDTADKNFWLLVIPLVFLFVESCVTCVYRSGKIPLIIVMISDADYSFFN